MLSYFYDDMPAWNEELPSPPSNPEPSGQPPTGRCRVSAYTIPRKKKHSPSERGAVLFLIFLVLILGGTAAIVFFSDTAPGGPSASTDHRSGAARGVVTLEQAPTGDGTILTLAAPQGGNLSFQEIYQRVMPSIVCITSMAPESVSQGTGVVMTANGYVITNAHVIENAFRVQIATSDNRSLEAKLVGMDEESDLAVLKVEVQDLTPALFGDSALTTVGDTVVAIGNPLGDELRGTMTDGIISAINRDITVGDWSMTLMQTTAALNTGNSGGALINQWGQVIGITNMKIMAQDSTIEGLGFAIPTATVKPIVDDLIACGHVTGRPALGITVQAMTTEEKEIAGVKHGLWLRNIQAASNARPAGLREGDILLSANGETLDRVQDLLDIKKSLQVGDTITFEAMRNGEEFTVDVTLVEQYALNAG